MTKIAVGFIYASIHRNFFSKSDTFYYFNDAIKISDTVLIYPQYYLKSWLGLAPPVPVNTDVFTYPSAAIFWKDLGTYMIVHVHALINYIAFDAYELHLFFIAIIGFYASLNFYKIFEKCLFLPKTILIIACFFFPSLIFWTAGLHKEAYIYWGLSLIVSSLYDFQTIRFDRKNSLKFLAGIIIIALFRYYLLALLLPAVVAYIGSLFSSRKAWKLYLGSYLVFSLVGSIFAQLLLGLDLLEILAYQQSLFFNEKGGSTIANIPPMTANIWSLVIMLPIAISNVFGRPFLWECHNFLEVMAAIEILCFSGLVIIAFVFKKPSTAETNPLVYFIISYAISNLLLIGILVINVGTIARYRSIALGLLSVLLTQILDFYKLGMRKENKNLPHPSLLKTVHKKAIRLYKKH